MKNWGGNKIIIVIAFLVISLFAANTFILNSNFKGDFSPRATKSILNYVQNENGFASQNGTEVRINGKENARRAEEEKEILDGTSEDNCFVDIEDRPLSLSSDESVRRGASGKVLIEQSTRRVLYGENENEKCYPASTTKVLTAYIALKHLPLELVVTVPKQAAGVEGSSIYLKAGEKITVEDLLFGLMLRSGNDAATALAIATSGSVQAFAELMNETAAELGAKNSHFVNPHGLHDDDHYTTPYDLALITAAAYELDDFKRIVGTSVHRIEVDGNVTAIGNKNKLLKLYEGANGVKTGFTKRSGRCLVGGAERENMQLISVALNCPDMWNETMAMLDFGFERYDMVALDGGLLRSQEGKKPVEVRVDGIVTQDWRDIFYPLAENEYVVLKAER